MMLTKLLGLSKASLTEALPYWEIKNGVVYLHSGQAEVGVEITLPSTTLRHEGELLRLHGALQNLLRHGVPEGERLRLLVEVGPLRRRLLEFYSQNRSNDHPVARLFSATKEGYFEEARLRGELVEYRAYLSCTVRQPGRTRLKRRSYPEGSLSPSELAAWEGRALRVRGRLIELLEQVGLYPTPMLDRELFELIWRYFNPQGRIDAAPQYQPPQVYLPHRYVAEGPHRAPATLRSRLAGADIAHFHWDHLRIGAYHLGALSMGSLPTGQTYVGMATVALGLPGLYWLICDYQHEPQGPITRALEAKARRFRSAEEDSGGFTSYVDASVRAGAAESDQAMMSVVQTGSHLYRLGMTVILAHPEREGLRRQMEAASSALARLPGVTPYQEGVALLEQFYALAPCAGRANERLHLVLEENAADFFPVNSPWRGSGRPVMLLLNRWNSLTALDPFDPKANNWNGIVIGGSGSGKTFAVQLLVSEALREQTEVMILDRGFGYAPLVELYGGSIVPFDASGAVAINPFDLSPGELEPSDEKKAFLLALVRAMLPNPTETDLSTVVEDAILTAAIYQTYTRALSERKINGVVERYYAGARLSDLVRVLVTLEEVGERPASPHEKEVARGLALRLQQWTGETPFGRLLDRETTLLPDAPVIYYETSRLESYPELQNVATLLIAEEIWKRVKRNPQQRKIVILDEFWALLKIPQAAAFIVELYRRFRRYNAAVYAITQSLQDFTGEAARGILQNTTYHFLLPLPGEDALIQQLLYLPDPALREYHNLAVAERYREILAWIRREGRLEGEVLRLVPRPLEYWAFTTNADDMAERARAVERQQGRLLLALQELAERYPYGVRHLRVG